MLFSHNSKVGQQALLRIVRRLRSSRSWLGTLARSSTVQPGTFFCLPGSPAGRIERSNFRVRSNVGPGEPRSSADIHAHKASHFRRIRGVYRKLLIPPKFYLPPRTS